MGNSESQSSLVYLQTITDNTFGQIDLYKSDEIAYLMKKTFTFIERNIHYTTCVANLKFMQDIRHSSVVPVHKIKHKQEKQICIQYDIIQAYVQYYNFTLDLLIKSGRKLDSQQLWYLLHELTDLGVLLKENRIKFKFNIDNIFISLNGIPCVYLFDNTPSFDEELEDELDKQKIMLKSLADVILKLVSNEEESAQLEILRNIDVNLSTLVREMLNGSISLEQSYAQIQKLKDQNKINLAKSLSVTTKLMGQIKKQTIPVQTRSVTESKQKLSIHPPSNTVSLKLPPKFVARQQTFNGIEEKKKNNTEKQLQMKRRMEQILCTQSKKQIEKDRNGKENLIKTLKNNTNSLSTSTVTSRQSLGVSQQIKPMRASGLWRKRALELIKKDR